MYKLVGNKTTAVSKDELKALGLQIYEQDECVICLCAKPNVLFKPCLHGVLCEPCYKLMGSKKCPMCRIEAKDIILIAIEPQ